MHCLYVGVASVLNEANMSNDIKQLTSELNGRTTDDFNYSWWHRNNYFQRIPLKDTTYEYICEPMILINKFKF